MTKNSELSNTKKDFIKRKCKEFLDVNNLVIVTIPEYPRYGDLSTPDGYNTYLVPKEFQYETSSKIKEHGIFISSC